MKTCSHCGTKNEEGRERCIQCGSPLLQIERIIEQDERTGQALLYGLIGAAIGALVGAPVGVLVGVVLRNAEVAAAGFFLMGFLGLLAGGLIGAVIGFVNTPRSRSR